jgi:hypothetical protein
MEPEAVMRSGKGRTGGTGRRSGEKKEASTKEGVVDPVQEQKIHAEEG